MKLEEEKRIRWAAVAVVFALILRLFSGGAWGRFVDALTTPEAVAWIFYLETGRKITALHVPQSVTGDRPQGGQTTNAPAQEKVQAVFAPEDAKTVQVHSYCGYSVDTQAMLEKPLSWDLTREGPAVLILHSHGTESYTKTENYTESSPYRTLDPNYSVVSVGSEIAATLEKGGIGVIHDTTPHDYPSYNDAYTHARESIRQYLTQYPSIRLVLDIHRDSSADSSGKQYGATVAAGDGEAARLMLVMGSDAGGQSHPNWQENLSLAVKLHALLERETPGICRDIILRSSRYNQDLSPGALLVEVGAAGNTRQEALLAGRLLAEGILALAYGTAA